MRKIQEYIITEIKPIVLSINSVETSSSTYDKTKKNNESLLKKTIMKASNIGFKKVYIIDNTNQSDQHEYNQIKAINKEIDITFIQESKFELSIKPFETSRNKNIKNRTLIYTILKDLIKQPFVYVNINSNVCANDLHLAFHYITNIKHNQDVFSVIGRKCKKGNLTDTNILIYSDAQNNIQHIINIENENTDLTQSSKTSSDIGLKFNLEEIVLWCFTPRVFDYIFKINADNFDFNNQESVTSTINTLLERELINCKLILN